MERILERYERYSYAERQLTATDHDSHGNWALEHARQKSRIELLQKTQRHINGEDLDSLSLKELQNLEHQLDTALKNIRLRKNQLMFESISVLQKKDKALQNQNNILSKKVQDVEKGLDKQPEADQQNHDNLDSFHFSTFLSTTCQAGGDGSVEEMPTQSQPSIVLPPWILQHINQ